MPVIRQQTRFVNQPIGVSNLDTGASQVSQAVSQFANNIGQMAYNIGAQAAEKRGTEQAQAVDVEKIRTIDPETGKPAALQSTQGMGNIAKQAYERVVDRRFAETITNDIRLKSREIASQYESPNQYDQMFSDYLGKLTEGADGRFKNMVMEVGGYELANTKITLADRARARARSAMAEGIVAGNTQASNEVYDASIAGDIDTALAIVEARTSATQDAESSELVRRGATASTRDSLATTAITGLFQSIHNTATPLQSASMDRYLATGGRQGADSLSADQKAALDKMLPYVNRNNIGDVLGASASIQADVSQVRSIESELAKQASEYQQRQNFLMYGDMNDIAAVTLMETMAPAFESGNLPQIAGSVAAADTTYRSYETQLRNEFVTGNISDTDLKSFLSDRQETILESILTQAAISGSQEQISSMSAALQTGDPQVVATLTPEQQTVVASLRGSSLLDDKMDFVNSLLTRSKDSFIAKRETELVTASILAEQQNLVQLLESGNAEAADVEAFMQNLDAQRGIVSGETINSLSNGLLTAQGKGLANAASSYASSADMIALSNYVKSNGSEDAGLAPYYRSIGDAILNSSGADDAVVGHINALQTRINQKETEREAVLAKQRILSDIQVGKGDGTDPAQRQAVDELFEQNNIDLTDPSSFNPAVQGLLRSVPAQSLVDDLSSIAEGRTVNGASVLLQHYAALANDPAGNVFINRFAGILSDERIAQLNDIVTINRDTGRPVEEIALMLSERRADPVSRAIREETLGGQSPSQWLMKNVETPPSVATELAPVVDYYALTGRTEEEIKLLMTDVYEGKYVESPIVVDPRYPVSDKNRSRYALEVTIPEQGAREEFLRIISSELPSGYFLNDGKPQAMSSELDTTQPDRGQPIFLVPDTSAGGLTYYLATLDNTNSLQMFIYEKDGEMVWPMYDRSELDAYYEDQKAKTAADLQQAQRKELARQAITWEGYQRLQSDMANRGMAAFGDYQATVFGRGQ